MPFSFPRFLNDLVLWEPQPPATAQPQFAFNEHVTMTSSDSIQPHVMQSSPYDLAGVYIIQLLLQYFLISMELQ